MVGDEITVTVGAQTFSPVRYNSFTVGPFSMKTIVKENETLDEAFARAHGWLMNRAREVYVAEREVFYNKIEKTNGGQ